MVIQELCRIEIEILISSHC